MQFKRKYQRRSYIDITPMIDVVFNLLLFFIVLAFLQNRQGIKINLPTAESSEKVATEVISDVTVTKEGLYYVNGESTRPENLSIALQRAFAASRDKVLFIRADGEVSHATVITVMDLARQAGFEKLSIAAKKDQVVR